MNSVKSILRNFGINKHRMGMLMFLTFIVDFPRVPGRAGGRERGGEREREREREKGRERGRERGGQDKTRQDYFIVRPPAHNNRVNIHTVSVIIESLIRLNFVF